ncbi:MAG: biotin/lipoyl-binding protein, partial [Ruminococcus sp.]|nr:biotin/lipoyl-binding protein [Ruminococcus sp.]
MNKSIILRTAAALSISAALLCGAASCGMSDLLNVPMTTYTVEHTDVENFISVSGTVEGSNIVKVTSDLTAKVKTLNVGVGSAVKAGDVLCVFDDTDYREQYDKLKESADTSQERLDSFHEKNQRALQEAKNQKTDLLRKAQRAIDSAVSARDSAYSKYNRLGTEVDEAYAAYYAEEDNAAADLLYKEYVALKEQYDTFGESLSQYDEAVQSARDAYNDTSKSADAAIQAAQEAINDEKFNKDTTVQDQLDKLKESIDKCTVTAPKDGIITALNIAEGSFPTTDALMTIEDTTALRINVSIN